MSNQHVLSEIARLESELLRIQRELDGLRKSVGGAPSTRRTQAFGPMRADKDADTREMPASQPPPQPSVRSHSETVPTSKSEKTEASKSDRRQAGAGTGLSDFPATTPTPLPPSRGRNSPAPDAGRYEFVGEGKSARRR